MCHLNGVFWIMEDLCYAESSFGEIAPDLKSCQKMIKTAPGVTLFHPYNGKGWATTVSLNPYFLSAVSTLKGEYSLSAKEGFHKSCISIVNECHCNMSRKQDSIEQELFANFSQKILVSSLVAQFNLHLDTSVLSLHCLAARLYFCRTVSRGNINSHDRRNKRRIHNFGDMWGCLRKG